MDYSSMSKKQLIQYIEQLKEQRAFSYEDRMKLRIIDEAPFTLWACDRNFLIRLWECQAPAMYGIKKDEALGKEYLTLFVAKDERVASETDCLAIIDEGDVFNNCIAEDVGKRGKCTVITNCFRVQDVETGEWLQAEIGLDISNLDEEKEKYARVIALSKQIKAECESYELQISEAVETAKGQLTKFKDRINSHRKEVVTNGKLSYYNKQIRETQSHIRKLERTLEKQKNDYINILRQIKTQEEATESKYDIEEFISELKTKIADIDIAIDDVYYKLRLVTENHNNAVSKKYKIALSYPKERRKIMTEIAEELAKKYNKESILFDMFHCEEFSGNNIDIRLQKFYTTESEMVVVFLCPEYGRNDWCQIEWRAIRAKMNSCKGFNVMFIRLSAFDANDIEGYLPTADSAMDTETMTSSEIANSIIKRFENGSSGNV